ncbi:MAG: hypothetical protein AAGK79_03145 [Pseudomonadota bacterium]
MTKPATTNASNTVVEQTHLGPQYVMDGYSPVTLRERLEAMGNAPLTPKRLCVQKPCDVGLFDETARNQLDLF